MVHGDDNGLVLPPRIAPVQIMVVPVQQQKEGVLDKAYELKERLTKAGFAVKVDDTDKSPGWKFADCEMRGVPLRVEIGPKGYGEEQMDSILAHMLSGEPFSELEYSIYSGLFLEFCVLGGMPNIVSRYIQQNNFQGSLQLQRQLLVDYEATSENMQRDWIRRRSLTSIDPSRHS